MKIKIALSLLLLCFLFVQTSEACDTQTPTITGDFTLGYNVNYSYTMTMDASYRNSAGGYTGTQWLIGTTPIGYGETINFNTNGWLNTYPPGDYTLTAKNQFANGCYGCITNSVFTKTISLGKANLIVTSPSLDTFSGDIKRNFNYSWDIKLRNLSTYYESAPCQVRLQWSSNGTLEGSDPQGGLFSFPSVSAGPTGGDVVLTKQVTTPNYSPNIFIFLTADFNGNVPESSESDNIGGYGFQSTAGRLSSYPEIDGSLINLDKLRRISDFEGKEWWNSDSGKIEDIKLLSNGLYIFAYQNGKTLELKKVYLDND